MIGKRAVAEQLETAEENLYHADYTFAALVERKAISKVLARKLLRDYAQRVRDLRALAGLPASDGSGREGV